MIPSHNLSMRTLERGMCMPFNLIQPPKPEVRRKLQFPSSWKVREATYEFKLCCSSMTIPRFCEEVLKNVFLLVNFAYNVFWIMREKTAMKQNLRVCSKQRVKRTFIYFLYRIKNLSITEDPFVIKTFIRKYA